VWRADLEHGIDWEISWNLELVGLAADMELESPRGWDRGCD